MDKTYYLLATLILVTTATLHAQLPNHVLPESTYPYWPSYQHLELDNLSSIEAQEWINYNHVVNGWDWSLPDFVEPTALSIVGLQRIIGLNKAYEPVNLKFKSNAVGILWVKWRDIEATMGDIDFTPVINRIKQANEAGVNIILRILCHSKLRNGDITRGEAPLWLEDLGVDLLPQESPKHNLNFNPLHPEFHKHYLMLVSRLAESDIPQMVKAAYVGYASHSFGDEGIGPYGENDLANDEVTEVRERLDAWENAFEGMEDKIFMGGSSEYGFQKGFGVRRGFVEMYLYNIPSPYTGQYIDGNGYLSVDEEAPILKYNCFNGEVNEEYEPAWATAGRDFRFGGTTNSFPYRYFTSTLRALQMRCTYMHTTGHLMPQILPFLSLELGRTVNNAPDVWTFLRTSYIRASYYQNNDYRNRPITATEFNEGIETKNFERWLYQRDAAGYETVPAVKIQHAIKMWMVEHDKYYDYIARSGQKIGFNIDDRWEGQNETYELAVKVTYFDNTFGDLELRYLVNNSEVVKKQKLLNDGKLKTTTIFITGLQNNACDQGYDFILTNSNQDNSITISMARVVIHSSKVGDLQEVRISTESGENTITQNQGTLQIIADPVPSSLKAPSVTWSLVNAVDVAMITAEGLLIALGNKNGFITVIATSKENPQISANYTVLISGQDIVSTMDLKNKKHFNLYPNPFSEFLKIENSINTEFSIYNCHGKNIYKSTREDFQVVDTKGWNNGIYLIHSSAGGYKLVKN